MRLSLITLTAMLLLTTSSCLSGNEIISPAETKIPVALADQWELVGEAINEPGWDIWGSSPIITDDGKVHLFVARWPGKFPFDSAWRIHSQIARYTADSPEEPFIFQETVLKGDGQGWGAQGYHNPNIQKVGNRFALTCIANSGQGNAKGHPGNQRIGIWVADKITGPWKPANGDSETPMLAPPEDPSIWCHKSGNGVTNPALLEMPDGTIRLYFKASPRGGHARMGLAIADKLEGPYVIQSESVTSNDRIIEDGYAFHWRGYVCLMTTDNKGMIEQGGGLLWASKDGIKFDTPMPGYHNLGRHYFPDGAPKTICHHYNSKIKCERPQILVIDGEPRYLYAPSGSALDGSDGTNCYLFRRRVKAKIAPPQPQSIPTETRTKFEAQQTAPHVLADPDWYCWGLTTFRWNDGKIHGYYARWPKNRGFASWLTHCEIAHAVAENPEGPFKTTGTVIKSRHLEGWDIVTAHNPTVCVAEDKIHLYYISNKLRGGFEKDGDKPYPSDKWLKTNRKQVRNRQCIGVAVADNPAGPFVRSPDPVVVPHGRFKNIAVNPAVTYRDGKFIMIVKGDDARRDKIFRIQLVGHADKAIGPFVFQQQPIYDKTQTEDACIWFDQSENLYHTVFHVMGKPTLAHLVSEDSFRWREAEPFTFMAKQFKLADGSVWKPERVERPFVLTDEKGHAEWIYLAIKGKRGSGNIAVPLVITGNRDE